ncbi:adenylate/guanylate cyclase domain-containing protein [Spirochaetia bacterium]|nr:adenylate/guanylate cyclase domain-containing protein [Spirochaetia bacterium]
MSGKKIRAAQPKVRFPIGIKLSLIIALLLILSLGAITVMMSLLIGQSVRLTAEDNNFNVNQRTTGAAEIIVTSLMSRTLFHLNALAAVPLDREALDMRNDFFFNQNSGIAGIITVNTGSGYRESEFFVSKRFFFNGGNGASSGRDSLIDTALLNVFIDVEADALLRAETGEVLMLNAAPFFGTGLLSLFFPQTGGAVIVLISSAELEKVFAHRETGNGQVSYMVNGDGALLIHHDRALVMTGADMKNDPFVRSILESADQSRQSLYTDENGGRYFGAYEKLSVVNAAVATVIPYDTVLRGINMAILRIVILSTAVLIISILIIIMFSGTLSKPLGLLTTAAAKIEQGIYTLEISPKRRKDKVSRDKINRSDEIGVLTESFIAMAHGLANFEKFTNKTIVRLARYGRLTRTGTGRQAAICFMLIRDFNESSKGLPAGEIVEFVNEFLARMVPCISVTGGVVDKFLTQDGVVVMALWGAAESAGSAEKDTMNCIRSALMMRAVLRCYNQERHFDNSRTIWKSTPVIKMGCGINIGEVVAGQMGSDERMEYTVIGDAVNLAARIEGPNDLFDTDILITENVWNMIGSALITKEMPGLEVKGKEQPLRVFTVINVKDREESVTIMKILEKLPGTDLQLSMQCVGSAGPHTLDEVRKRWEPTELPSFFRRGIKLRGM